MVSTAIDLQQKYFPAHQTCRISFPPFRMILRSFASVCRCVRPSIASTKLLHVNTAHVSLIVSRGFRVDHDLINSVDRYRCVPLQNPSFLRLCLLPQQPLHILSELLRIKHRAHFPRREPENFA